MIYKTAWSNVSKGIFSLYLETYTNTLRGLELFTISAFMRFEPSEYMLNISIIFGHDIFNTHEVGITGIL